MAACAANYEHEQNNVQVAGVDGMAANAIARKRAQVTATLLLVAHSSR